MTQVFDGTSGASAVGAGTVGATQIIDNSIPQTKLSQSITLMTAQATTSGTSIDFTGIPSWVKRVSVIFSGVSTTGTASVLVQIGSGSVTTSGYNSAGAACLNGGAPSVGGSTSGFLIFWDTASDLMSGEMDISLMGSYKYISSHNLAGASTRTIMRWGNGDITLGGAIDRVRIVTTDTFDAGSVNIMYE